MMKKIKAALSAFLLLAYACAGAQSTVSNPPTSIRIGNAQPFAAIAVNMVRTTINRHAFEDWSTLNTVDSNTGYASFDAKATMNNPSAQQHFVGYQSRNIYAGSGGLTDYWHGYDTAMVHNGTGTIAFAAGIHLRDVGGSGPITANYGLYIDSISRGTTHYSIYSVGGAHYFGGNVQTPILLMSADSSGVNFGTDGAGKTINYGFGTGGQTNFGQHVFYNGKNTVVATIDKDGLAVPGRVKTPSLLMDAANSGIDFGQDVGSKTINYGYGTTGTSFAGAHKFYEGRNTLVAQIDLNGLAVTGKVTATGAVQATGVMTPGGYTFSALPSAPAGSVTYCSDCLKSGESTGAGTGVMAYYSNGAWRRLRDDAVVTH